MSDALDDTQKTEAMFLSAALQKRKPELHSIGLCHWCKEPVLDSAHFCDPDCRSDFEQHKAFKR